ncbi:Uncharacterised protein [Mycobacterium tuberculosis]|nr:Uncharacterised protein [Mycobacterium tuberculosis]
MFNFKVFFFFNIIIIICKLFFNIVTRWDVKNRLCFQDALLIFFFWNILDITEGLILFYVSLYQLRVIIF